MSISIIDPCQIVFNIWSCQKCPHFENDLGFKGYNERKENI